MSTHLYFPNVLSPPPPRRQVFPFALCRPPQLHIPTYVEYLSPCAATCPADVA